MSRHYPFCLSTLPTVFAASLALLMPASVSLLHAQTAPQQAALSDSAKTGNKAGNNTEKKPAAEDGAQHAAVDPAAQKGIAGKAIDKVKEVAKSAGDILPAACRACRPKGGSKSMGSLPHVASKLVAGPAGGDRRLRIVVDRRLRGDLAGFQLSQPARRAIAPAISGRLHLRRQCRQGRRGCAGNDEAAADGRHRPASGSGDLAGRHQRRAAQPRSGRDGKARRGRRRAHSGCWRRRRA